MSNLLVNHPSDEVRSATVRLLDALCMWERTTGRQNLVIIKDKIGCEYRSMGGAPIPDNVSDEQALECFRNMT